MNSLRSKWWSIALPPPTSLFFRLSSKKIGVQIEIKKIKKARKRPPSGRGSLAEVGVGVSGCGGTRDGTFSKFFLEPTPCTLLFFTLNPPDKLPVSLFGPHPFFHASIVVSVACCSLDCATAGQWNYDRDSGLVLRMLVNDMT